MKDHLPHSKPSKKTNPKWPAHTYPRLVSNSDYIVKDVSDQMNLLPPPPEF